MSPTQRIRFRPRPLLAMTLVALLMTGVGLRTFAGGATNVPNGSKQHGTTTTTTVPPSDVVVNTAAFTPPRRGCTFDARTPATKAAPPRPGRCEILEIGDSLGVDLGYGLYHQLTPPAGVSFVSTAKESTGLVNTNFYNWPLHLRQDLALYRPHLVIISLGANDNHSLAVHGESQLFGTREWRIAYSQRLHQIMTEATASGAYVLWVGMPIMQNPIFSQDVQIINSLARTVAGQTRGAAYVSVWSVLASPQGKYRAGAYVNGVSAGLRGADGIHVNNVGAGVLATFVTTKVADIYHVRLAPAHPMVITG